MSKATVKKTSSKRKQAKAVKKSAASDKDVCCPFFYPEKWDEKKIRWNGKHFVMDSIPALFHIPFPPMIGKSIRKMMRLIDDAGKAENKKEDTLVLFRDPSPFKSEIYISTEGNVPGAMNVKVSGTFAAKVFDGGYNEIPKFIKAMEPFLQKKYKIEKLSGADYYVHYAYCPSCQKKYGHNYMILFAKIH
jgi:hypothetical protein